VAHPRRWVTANVSAWAVAMPIIFVGATTPGAGWAPLAVIALGTVTGLAAGAALGLVTGWFLPSLTGLPVHDRFVLAVLASPVHGLLDRNLLGLQLRGVVTGRTIALPTMYAADDAGLVVVPGRPGRKRWWRNLRRASPVRVLLDGRWGPGSGRLLEPGSDGYDQALTTYRERWPRVPDLDGGPVVRIQLEAAPPPR